jgi:hypothetical protein
LVVTSVSMVCESGLSCAGHAFAAGCLNGVAAAFVLVIGGDIPDAGMNRLHSALGLHTPASVHIGDAIHIRQRRQKTLDRAYTANADRFHNRPPIAPKLPTVAWINPPTPEPLIQSA